MLDYKTATYRDVAIETHWREAYVNKRLSWRYRGEIWPTLTRKAAFMETTKRQLRVKFSKLAKEKLAVRYLFTAGTVVLPCSPQGVCYVVKQWTLNGQDQRGSKEQLVAIDIYKSPLVRTVFTPRYANAQVSTLLSLTVSAYATMPSSLLYIAERRGEGIPLDF